MKAIVTGSFDPVTAGHLDIIERASRVFDEVYAVIFNNRRKEHFFSPESRLSMLKKACENLGNVSVDYSEGFVADYCLEHGIGVIVRGIRDSSDVEYEINMADNNRILGSGLETVFFPARKGLAGISASAVREELEKGGSTVLYPWIGYNSDNNS